MDAVFDFAVFASYPRGLYLAKKLSTIGKKVAYIEISTYLKSPFGLFLTEDMQEEKNFLLSVGFLLKQNEGFSVLSPEGVWTLQEKKHKNLSPCILNRKMHAFYLDNDMFDFEDNWLSFLALNLSAKVFSYNNSNLSSKRLDFFSDYFLFSPCFKKRNYFKKHCPDISFFMAELQDIELKGECFFLHNKVLNSKKYFWLGANYGKSFFLKSCSPPSWYWQAYYFKVDFVDYKDVIPFHFVSIKHIFLPWSHDNLLSVFHREGFLEVWVRQALSHSLKVNTFQKDIIEHLNIYFPGIKFTAIRDTFKSYAVYNKQRLDKKSAITDKIYREDLNDFFQADLASEIQEEKRLFYKLIKTLK